MDTRITLRAARANAGYTLTDAAAHIGMSSDTLTKLERDSTDIPRSVMLKMEQLYQYPIDNIFFGSESDFIRIKREKLSEEGGLHGNGIAN